MNVKIKAQPNCYFLSSKDLNCDHKSLFFCKDEKKIYYHIISDEYLDTYQEIDCSVYEISLTNVCADEYKDNQALSLIIILPLDDTEISFLGFSKNLMDFLKDSKCETPIRTSIYFTESLINHSLEKSEESIQFSKNVADDKDIANKDNRYTNIACYFYYILKQKLLDVLLQKNKKTEILSIPLSKLAQSIVNNCTNEVKTVDDSIIKLFDENGTNPIQQLPFFFIIYYFLSNKKETNFTNIYRSMKKNNQNYNLRRLMSDLISSYNMLEYNKYEYSLLIHANAGQKKNINRYGTYCDFIFPILVMHLLSDETLNKLSDCLKKIANHVGSSKIYINEKAYNDLKNVKIFFIPDGKKKSIFQRKSYFSIFNKKSPSKELFFDRLEHSPNIITKHIMSCIIFSISDSQYKVNDNNFSGILMTSYNFTNIFFEINQKYFDKVVDIRCDGSEERNIFFRNNTSEIQKLFSTLNNSLKAFIHKGEKSYFQEKEFYFQNKYIINKITSIAEQHQKYLRSYLEKSSSNYLCKDTYFSVEYNQNTLPNVLFTQGGINKNQEEIYRNLIKLP